MLLVEDLVRHYPVRGQRGRVVRAVDGLSFVVGRGETLGRVGESGCGKSSTARMLVGLDVPTSGRILLDGVDVVRARRGARRALRRRVQLVFQDPHAALNPRLPVGDAIAEVLRVHGLGGDRTGRRRRVGELLEQVGLGAEQASRYPHQLSGGQRQRIGIARALAVEPDLLVLDEPVSGLDVSVRAEVMNLFARLRDELGLTYVFISHDLGMVRHISDRIGVMYLGRIVELGPWKRVSDAPLHPYTAALQAAVPAPDPVIEAGRDMQPLSGEVPDPADPPPGCRFHPRCPLRDQPCDRREPVLVELAPAHLVACHLARGPGHIPGTAPRLEARRVG
jgi:oligopeptide/dipeptide ABC transporter ATP-binding protein